VNIPDGEELLGINSLAELERAGKVIFRRKALALMATGVTILDSETTFIEEDVDVQPDTVIYPFSLLMGSSRIGRRCTIGPLAHISDSSIGDDCWIEASTIRSARLSNSVRVGPYSHVRPSSDLGPAVEVGTHAEIKNSSLGAGTRMHHFGYLGDAEIGKDVNIGAGTVTCNYDGKAKHQTVIGDRAFIGSDTMLRAPIHVGDEAVTGAGSVVIEDVAAGSRVAGVPAREISSKPSRTPPGKDGREGE
jgi:bifunctional UDP-N-acetylglucosamine pyrophosphorylase/glucosamine-1-phosphate N-acetyltransferase